MQPRDDNTFALVDLLHDLVSRYTHMRINYLPLSLRGGSDSSAINFMFPKDSTIGKNFYVLIIAINCKNGCSWHE